MTYAPAAAFAAAVLLFLAGPGVPGSTQESGQAGSGPSGSALEIPDEGLDFEALEKELLRKALEKGGGVATKAAKLLGMSYKTFLYRLEKFGLG